MAMKRHARKARAEEVERWRQEAGDAEEGGLSEEEMAETERQYMEELAKENQKLRELGRLIPGPDTAKPRDKIWSFLIAEYGFPPESLWRMTYPMMKLYIEARQGKPGVSRGGSVGGGEESAVPAKARAPRGQALARDRKAEARDGWLYKQARKKASPTWKALLAKLNRVAAKKGWRKLGSVQAVQQAVGRYIERKGYDPLPRRKEA